MNPIPVTNEATAQAPNGAGSSELHNLIADIQAVLARADQVADFDVTKLGERLRQKLTMATSGIVDGGRRAAEAARTAASATDDYVHHSPWQAICVAAVAGAAVGYLLAKR